MDLQQALQLGTLLGVVVGLFQLRQVIRKGKDDNYTAFLTRLAEHNWRCIESDARRYAIDIFLNLNVPPPNELPSDRELYWATRAVHISHLNLLEHIWALASRSRFAQSRELKDRFKEWARLGSRLSWHLKKPNEIATAPLPYRRACQDLMAEFLTFSRAPEDYRAWLLSLPEPTNAEKNFTVQDSTIVVSTTSDGCP
jgi:hypothetical protein